VGRARLLGPALMGAALMAAMVPSAASADTDLAIGGDGVVAYANEDSVRLRTAPGYDAGTIDYIPEGTAVSVENGVFWTDDGSGWYQVTAAGATGYVDSTYLAASGSLYIRTSGTAVTNDSVNLRSGPSTADGVLVQVPAGASVTLTGDTHDGWLSAGYDGSWGYVYAAFLGAGRAAPAPAPEPSQPAPVPAEPDIAWDGTTGTRYTNDALNLRSGPGTDQGVLTVLAAGGSVSLTGAWSGTWVQVDVDDTGSGWVSADFLTDVAPSAPAAPAQPAPAASGIAWPISGGEWEITQGYHGSSHINSDGTWQYDYSFDLARSDGGTAGQAVYAPVNGTIRWFDPGTGGVSIDLGNGYAVAMFHAEFDGSLQVGQSISQGQYLGTIAYPGGGGNGGFPHLHLTLWATDDGGNWSRSAVPFTGQNAISGVEFGDDGTYSDHAGYIFYP
jgi:uncharacterized protein YgiM (DUF1202 family)